MQDVTPSLDHCTVPRTTIAPRKERRVLAVVILTAAMMVAELVAGYATGSMALLADGWHMATHVGALGLASAAYALARRYAMHRAFTFGTGKIHALAGYTSAVVLGLVAVAMIVESAARLLSPRSIDFTSSLPVAIVGLVVNLASVALLHDHEDDDHDDLHHDHDHNHRAALLHVVADTFTSALAIAALVVGLTTGWIWLDSVTGIVGGVVILAWGVGLCRNTGMALLDVEPSPALARNIRSALEAVDDVRVRDLHVWAIGRGARSCIATVVSATPRDVTEYRQRLAGFGLAHLTIEVQRDPPS